ncbi:Nn.00g095420.m01.CDS01 [Neocucurbitaria sp. VM-36]
MFVPRALRLKGVREHQRPQALKAVAQPPTDRMEICTEDALVEAMEKTSTTSPAQQLEHIDSRPVNRGPRFTSKPVTPEYLAQLSAGTELIFTDYAHQEETRAKWLQTHYRIVDEQDRFVHLTAILEHPNISSMRPEASQVLLQQALQSHPSAILEISQNGYYVRRIPASYPPTFLPEKSFEVVDDDGLSFWDQRTIYIEPHLRNLCQTPAKVAYWLQEYGQLRPKWLPIQAVHMLWNSCAFVVLSGSVMHDDTWAKWRAAEKPENWKIMSKVDHTMRTAEYIALLEQQNPKGMRRNKVDDIKLPAIARPAALPMNAESIPVEYLEEPKAKRKRRKNNGAKASLLINDTPATNIAAEEAENDEPSRKRRA